MKHLAIEKKAFRRSMNSCIGCGKNHRMSRVEDARIRRVEAAVRRRKRRDARKPERVSAEYGQPQRFTFNLKVDTSVFVRQMEAYKKGFREFGEALTVVADSVLGNLRDKSFTGLIIEPNIKVFESEEYYIDRPKQHARRPNSDETICGISWVRPHSDDQINAIVCPGCFTADLVPQVN